MELNLELFKKIELFGWATAIFMVLFFFGHFFLFIAVAVGIRRLYMLFKQNKLGPLPAVGKAVVVTGCDSGFGLALAKRLHTKGFKVFAMCLNLKSDGATALRDIESDCLKVIQLDITDDEMVSKSLERVAMECDHSGLWGLINNAGQDFLGDAELATIDQYMRIANINLFGMVRVTKAFLPLVRQAKGRIVNVTSVKGMVATPYTAPYTMAKFGGEAFSDILRLELSGQDIKVIIVEPCNFGGITGCLNEEGLARMSVNLDAMWAGASADVKQHFGEAHLQKLLEAARDSKNTSHPTMDPVIDAFEDALTNVCPHIRYLVPGSNYYFDIYAVLARVAPYLPQTLFEKLRSYFFPYILFK